MKLPWEKKEITFVINQHKKGFSRFDIAKLFVEKFLYYRSPDSIKHCIDVYGQDVELYVPRVLVLDIETRAATAKVWGLWDQNVGLNQLVDDGGILCWSAKFLGEKEIFYKDMKGDPKKEKQLLEPIWKLMDESDIILGQNHIQFDLKKLNAKFLEHGMGAPSCYKKIDTKLMAKRYFSFLSNKLEYMSNKFCSAKKLSHSKFPGYLLWLECEKGNKAAWAEMKAYNIADVKATEELFLKLAQFDKTKTVQDALRAYNLAKKK